jgi:hypothetical protein
MANRVLIGDRSTGGYGLYVSKNGEDVLTTTNSLQFDSRMGASMVVHSYGQGSIAGGASAHTITHNLGYIPTVAVRWSDPDDISGGVASKAYNLASVTMDYVEYEGEEESASGESTWGIGVSNGNNAITISNLSSSQGDHSGTRDIYYAFVVFHQANIGAIL